MATLFRPTWTAYYTPNGKRCPKGTPGATRKRGQSNCWHGRYRDEHGKEVTARLSEVKATARQMLAELVRSAELARVGLGDPYARHRSRPIAEHLADYVADLRARGDTPGHCARTAQRVRDVLAEAKATLVEHVTASGVLAALAALRARADSRPPLPAGDAFTGPQLAALLGVHPHSLARIARRLAILIGNRGRATRYTRDMAEAIRSALPGMGVATANHYLRACKSFTRWLVRDRRTATDVLSHIQLQNTRTDVRRRRRALPPEEFARLLEASRSGPVVCGLTGRQRWEIYTLAVNTGLRAGEIASLTAESFDFHRLTVTVQAAYSKRRREDVLPLREDVAEVMRAATVGIPTDRPVWPGTWHRKLASIVRVDLAAAGIPYADAQGRVFDGHALRMQFVTMLGAAGVPLRVVQELARHSDPRLTVNTYTDPALFDVRGALDKLPEISQGKPPTEGDVPGHTG